MLTTKYSASLKLCKGSGTRVRLVQKITVTAMHKYTLHKTPKADEKRRALIERGRDMGNKMPKEKIVPQNFWPQ